MRAAAYPRKNQRNLKLAYVLVWFCYASMGLFANLCPPLGNAEALADPNQGKNSFLSVKQAPSMASLLLVSRMAVLIQSITVYPILLYIIRAQVIRRGVVAVVLPPTAATHHHSCRVSK